MAKPLLVVYCGDTERMSVLLQKKMDDWHVLCVPSDELKFEVYSVNDAMESFADEIRQQIFEIYGKSKLEGKV